MQAADRISNQPPVLLPYKCKASILFCVLAETKGYSFSRQDFMRFFAGN